MNYCSNNIIFELIRMEITLSKALQERRARFERERGLRGLAPATAQNLQYSTVSGMTQGLGVVNQAHPVCSFFLLSN